MTVNAAFRKAFEFPFRSNPNWYPGHMRKSLKQLQSLLSITDCVLEVHDARIPLSGRNVDFKRTLTGVRPHILVLNKADLSLHGNQDRKNLITQLKMQDPSLSEVLFTSCLNSSIKKVLPKCLEVIENFPRYERGGGAERNIIVIGIPNVGKSSLINHIRNNRFKISGDATRVGALPGVTRALQTKIRVNQDPLTYVWDSPGILFPSMKNESVALKLAVCKCLRDDLIGEKIVADYLLFHLNKYQHFKYVKTLGLEAPTDNIDTLLTQIAVNHNWINKVKNLVNNSMEEMPNKKQASTYFLMLFRKGKFGSINLDSDELDTKNKTSGKILITI